MRRQIAVISAAAMCAGLLGAGALGAGAASPLAASTNSSLAAVSCPSATTCVAVGYATLSGVEVPLAESWDGKTWKLQTLARPAGFSHGPFNAVSCSSATSCMAVGWYDNTKAAQLMLADEWNGTAWKILAVPAPATYYGQSLGGVGCVSATSCYAVGSYFMSSGREVTIGEYWNGKRWAQQLTPPGTPKYLVGLSCASGTSCGAIGSYTKGGGSEQTLAEHWNGKSWTTQSGANPPGSQGTYPVGLSCPTPNSCVAVGYYQASTGYRRLAESWNGKVWAILPTAKPAKGDSEWFGGVSCTSATGCVAVGYGQNAAGTPSTLAGTWNGKAWTGVATAAPTGSAGASLFGVSCSASTACTAVGTYQKGSISLTLAERWNGKSWVLQSGPKV